MAAFARESATCAGRADPQIKEISMRTLSALVVLLPSLLITSTALSETVYGKGIAGFQKVAISELLADPDAYVDKEVQVEGLVLDVCPRRGCWIEIASDKEFQSLRFKVDDGVISFPMEAKGRRVVAEGVFRKYTLSREDLIARAKHRAEEKGEAFDESTVTGPETYYQIEGIGARVE
jgi:hypothetical protein